MTQPRGLYNNCNTCYFNAVIQSLHRTTALVQYVKDVFPSTSKASVFPSTFEETKNPEKKQWPWIWLLRAACSVSGFAFGLHFGWSPLKFLWSKFKNVLPSFALKASKCMNERNLNFQQYLDSLWTCPAQNKYATGSKNQIVYLMLAVTGVAILVKLRLSRHSQNSYSAKLRCWVKKYSLYMDLQSSRIIEVLLCDIVVPLLCYILGCLVKLSHSDASMNLRLMILEAIILATIAAIVYYFIRKEKESKPVPLSSLLIQTAKLVGVALKILFDELSSTTDKGSVDPGFLLEAVSSRAPRFAGHNQQDSHELLRHLLDGLRVDERQLNQLKEIMAKLTLVDKIFGGHFITVYTCLYCKEVYSLCEPFLDISLPLVIHKDTLKEVSVGISPPPVTQDTLEGDSDDASPPAGEQDTLKEVSVGISPPPVIQEDTSQDASDPIENQEMYLMEHNVETLLKVYTRKEHLGKEYLCNACNKDRTDGGYDLTEGTKEALICDPPAVLCLHMKRFKEVPGAGYFEKVNAHITFNEFLDLKPYLSKDCKRVDIKQTSVLYSLYGVVVHSGSLRGGHYVAYVKSHEEQMWADDWKKFLQREDTESQKLTIDRDNSDLVPTTVCGGNQQELKSTKDWYYCSDSMVHRVDASEVFQQQAFLLFYERIC